MVHRFCFLDVPDLVGRSPGFKLRAGTLTIEPAIPLDWPGFDLRYKYHSTTYEIKVQREVLFTAAVLQLDGQLVSGNKIHLIDDGRIHGVLLRLPKTQRLLQAGSQAFESGTEQDTKQDVASSIV